MKSDSIVIREARADEWEKASWLHRDEGEEYMKGSRERNQIRFARIPKGIQIVLFAEWQEQVVGAIQLQLLHKNRELADGKTIAHVDDLVVDPDVRGQGIGKHLMQQTEAVLHERSFSKITLGVSYGEKHAGLCQFYDKHGYQVWYEKADGLATVLHKTI